MGCGDIAPFQHIEGSQGKRSPPKRLAKGTGADDSRTVALPYPPFRIQLTPPSGTPSIVERDCPPQNGYDRRRAKRLERDIRQLKIEYDQFFGGGRKRPPSEIEWRIELVIKKYGERGGEMKFNQRFRFTNLSQTYAKYKDIFRKRMKQKEEGATQ